MFIKLFNSIDTVNGFCEHCNEEVVLVGLVTDYYRCTTCGEDTRQYINGSIKYLKVNEQDKEWLKRNPDKVCSVDNLHPNWRKQTLEDDMICEDTPEDEE